MTTPEAPTARTVLVDTIHRYQCEFCDPPSLIRVTRGLHLMLREEMTHWIHDANLPCMPGDEFTFCGVRCKSTLPGPSIAALAIHESTRPS